MAGTPLLGGIWLGSGLGLVVAGARHLWARGEWGSPVGELAPVGLMLVRSRCSCFGAER